MLRPKDEAADRFPRQVLGALRWLAFTRHSSKPEPAYYYTYHLDKCRRFLQQHNFPSDVSLKAFVNERRAIPWVRVYKLPGFVYFSHQVHNTRARIECAICHGPVAERSIISQEKSTAMVDCMKCHDQYKASNRCDLCHDSQ